MIYCFKFSGGSNLIQKHQKTPEVAATLLSLLKSLKESGLKNLVTRSIDTKKNPKIFEIKQGRVRLFYYITGEDIYICNIDDNKQKNKTEQHVKKTARTRADLMFRSPQNIVVIG